MPKYRWRVVMALVIIAQVLAYRELQEKYDAAIALSSPIKGVPLIDAKTGDYYGANHQQEREDGSRSPYLHLRPADSIRLAIIGTFIWFCGLFATCWQIYVDGNIRRAAWWGGIGCVGVGGGLLALWL